MSETAEPAQEDETILFSEVLRRLAGEPGEKLSVGHVVEAFGERAFGALMLFVGMLNLIPWPPGGTTIFGAPLLFITAQLAIGREVLWLPKWICRTSFDRSSFRRGLERILPTLQKVERLTKPRMPLFIGSAAERLIGVATLLLSCILVLPIWGGNFAPAVAICVFAVALVQRDGLVAIIGWIAVAVSVTVLALAARVIWALGVNAWEWIQRVLG